MANVTSNEQVPVSLGRAIKERRIELGLRVEDVASKSKLAARTVTRVEKGEDLRYSTLERFAEALDCTVGELIEAANSLGDAA